MADEYPLHVRGDQQKEEAYDALIDGVPGHLRQVLIGWLSTPLWNEYLHEYMPDRVSDIGLYLRAELDWSAGSKSAARTIMAWATEQPKVFLSAIDYALQHWPMQVAELDKALEAGGSLWSVRMFGQQCRLVRRMDESVQAAVDATIKKSKRAGEYLRDALLAIYGRHPNPSNGYRECVRAVEVAAIAVVLPNDKDATLGRVIGELKADIKGPKRWKLALGVDTKVDPTDVLRSMLELLWTNHFDRHGTHDESVPLNVSPEQAETGFHLATTLVEWFTSGKVVK